MPLTRRLLVLSTARSLTLITMTRCLCNAGKLIVDVRCYSHRRRRDFLCWGGYVLLDIKSEIDLKSMLGADAKAAGTIDPNDPQAPMGYLRGSLREV
jgi:hypothetical protein